MLLTNLRTIRKNRAVRVQALAAAAGLTPGHIYLLERQERGASQPTAMILALLLGVNVCDLTGEAGADAEAAHVRPLIGQNKEV